MKKLTIYVLLFFAFFIPYFSFGMLKKIEDTLLNVAEKLYEKAGETFKVKDEVLFERKKPLEIIQFPSFSETTDTQTHEIAKEIIRKLSKAGISQDNIKKSKLYYKNDTDVLQALKILKAQYPALANKTTLHKWEGEMPNPKYKIFIEIKANSIPKKKKAKL